MKYQIKPAALAAVLLLSACAGQDAKPDAAAAIVATSPASEPSKEQISLFVNHARLGEFAAVKQGLDQGLPVNAFDQLGQTALLAAISHDSLEEVQLLLAHGADPNLADGAGWTSLHYAAWFGSSPVVLKELLDHGSSIDARNGRDITALYFASVTGHQSQVKLLLDRGADRTLASKAGYTPLRAAKVKGYFAVVALLDPSESQDATASKAAPAPGAGTH